MLIGRRGNGEGTITRRKDGRWEVKYTVHKAEGMKRRAHYGKTRAEVAEKLTRALSDRSSRLANFDLHGKPRSRCYHIDAGRSTTRGRRSSVKPKLYNTRR